MIDALLLAEDHAIRAMTGLRCLSDAQAGEVCDVLLVAFAEARAWLPQAVHAAPRKRQSVPCGVEYLDGRAIRVSCSRCSHATESLGMTDRSIRRCLALLREECPQGERNYYTAASAAGG